MILSFSQQINGKPTYFAEKINKAIAFSNDILIDDFYEYAKFRYNLNKEVYKTCLSKLHTIRLDTKERWHRGNKIHAYYNNRTKNAYQVAPTIYCQGVQKIFIKYEYFRSLPVVTIDDKTVLLNEDELKALAINDGFESLSDFCDYFNQDFTGKIIHWTDLRY